MATETTPPVSADDEGWGGGAEYFGRVVEGSCSLKGGSIPTVVDDKEDATELMSLRRVKYDVAMVPSSCAIDRKVVLLLMVAWYACPMC